jgi:hypothetical protein
MRITESQLRRIIREEASRLAGGPNTPQGAAEAVVAALGTSGAEDLVDRMYAARGVPAVRLADKSFVEAMVAAGVSPTLARDPDFGSEVYSALVDIVNPWDAPR